MAGDSRVQHIAGASSGDSPTYRPPTKSSKKRGTGKSKGAQRMVEKMKTIPVTYSTPTGGSRAVKLTEPSWYAGMTSVPKWIADPVATYQVPNNGSVNMYQFPLGSKRFYVHSATGQVVEINRKNEMYIYKNGLKSGEVGHRIQTLPFWLSAYWV